VPCLVIAEYVLVHKNASKFDNTNIGNTVLITSLEMKRFSVLIT
jgi:hypothetical protein